MNKRLLTVFSVVVLLAIVIVACIHLFPSSPEGYVDLVEIVEIGKYSDEELQRRMVGQYRVDNCRQLLKPSQTLMFMNSRISIIS